MIEDPKKTIYLDISACPGQGKTSTALILQDYLKKLGFSVEVRDVDFDQSSLTQRSDLLTKAVEDKTFKNRNIIIRTRQLSRDPQRGIDGEVLPGKF